MKSPYGIIGTFVLMSFVLPLSAPSPAFAAEAAGVALQTAVPQRYRLTAQQAAGLIAAIIDDGRPAAPGRAVQGLRLAATPPPAAGLRFLFLAQGEWTFLPRTRLFEQVDSKGNRLVLHASGKAQVFSRRNILLGTLEDPPLVRLHSALYALTM